jgi:hypothetical protein
LRRAKADATHSVFAIGLPFYRSYFGGRSSLANQAAATGDMIGSTSSQLTQVGLRGPLPSGGDTNTSGLPQRAQFAVLGISPIA